MAPVSGSSEQSVEKKGKSRFSMKKKKKEDKASPEKEVPDADQTATLLSPQTGSERRSSDSSSVNTSNVTINTPDTPKRKSGLNMSFRKKDKKKGNRGSLGGHVGVF
jgi:hypothetical protein